ncbi:synaptonemal complex protein 2-like isoform X2 [Gigantopelta aegis]|uniref:synaptonemal complex protein 2-like isoform X2 n=1 Tax=Gigantopelta aegis TaxID=1735272 RepID=UPI001B8881BD|nr:synaptonemal complex protein 2-like isoform X2 [Gigantopelta aegis]
MDEILHNFDEIHSSIANGTDVKSFNPQKLELLQILSKNVPEDERSRRASVLLEQLKSIISSVKHDEDLLLKILDSCLLNLVSVLFSSFEDSIYPQEDSDGLLEELLDIISVLVDGGSKVQALIIGSLSNEYVGIITGVKCPFGHKMEVLKSYNVLLESCPLVAKQELVHSKIFFEKLKLLFNLIFHIGDYEFQVGTLECIFRLVPRKVRPQYASKFVQNTELISAFLMIKDGNFETDCRSFLNCLNKQMKVRRRVLSVPCIKAVLGKKKLTKPDDPGYDDFWVDFNFGSKRLTIFCEQDSSNVYSQRSMEYEDMWETVSIWTNDIQSYQCVDNRSVTSVTLVLKKSVTELFPHMVEAEGNELCLLFDDKWCISEALRRTLGLKQPSLKKVSSVNEPLHLFMRNGSLQTGNLTVKSPYPDSAVCNRIQAHLAQTEAHLSQTESCFSRTQSNLSQTPGGPKMSVPSVPMRTPTRYITPSLAASNGLITPVSCASNVTASKCLSSSKLSDGKSAKISTSKCSVNIHLDSESEARDFKAPRTPQNKIKPRPKVKTPVVTIGAPRLRDKTSQLQNTIEIQNSKPAGNQVMIDKSLGQKMVDDIVIPDSIPDLQFVQKETKSGRKSTMDDSGIGLNESDLSNEKAKHQAKKKEKAGQDDKHLSENETFVSDISDTDEVKHNTSRTATKKRKKNRKKPSTQLFFY